MYAFYTLRSFPDPSKAGELRQRAEQEFWPKMRQAPGFQEFFIIQGQDGAGLAVAIFDTQQHAQAFQQQSQAWFQVLDQYTQQVGNGHGNVVTHVTPQ